MLAASVAGELRDAMATAPPALRKSRRVRAVPALGVPCVLTAQS